MNTLWQLLTQIRRVFEWWVVVQPWEQALRVRLGKHVRRLGSGCHLRVPFADVIYRQSVRMRWCDLSTQTITTADGKAVTLSAALGYQIADIERLYQSLHHAEGTLQYLAMCAIAEAVHGAQAADCRPETVQDRADAALQLEPYGIADASIRVTDFAFVRTYRLIQDQKWGGTGDQLNTNRIPGTPEY